MVMPNLEQVRARIATAARGVGRSPAEIRLVCVTKGVEPKQIQEAIACGVQEIGENRIQEAQAKQSIIGREVRWHLVGHLQRNKAKHAVELFDVIHSVDSLALIEALDRQAAARGVGAASQVLEVLIQVNVSGEATKSGCKPEETKELALALLKSQSLKWAGLMTMAPFSDDPEQARPFFRQLRELRDRLQEKFVRSSLHLSMGMSQDFEVAVQEGATMVRIGTAIFR